MKRGNKGRKGENKQRKKKVGKEESGEIREELGKGERNINRKK